MSLLKVLFYVYNNLTGKIIKIKISSTIEMIILFQFNIDWKKSALKNQVAQLEFKQSTFTLNVLHKRMLDAHP